MDLCKYVSKIEVRSIIPIQEIITTITTHGHEPFPLRWGIQKACIIALDFNEAIAFIFHQCTNSCPLQLKSNSLSIEKHFKETKREISRDDFELKESKTMENPSRRERGIRKPFKK